MRHSLPQPGFIYQPKARHELLWERWPIHSSTRKGLPPGRETRASRRRFAATPSGLRTPLRPHPAPPLRRRAALSAGIRLGFAASRPYRSEEKFVIPVVQPGK